MFEIKEIREVPLSDVDSLINDFFSEENKNFCLDRFFFRKAHQYTDEECVNFGQDAYGYHFFNPLMEAFPFFTSNYTNGVILIKAPKDSFTDDSLISLLKWDDSLELEIKRINEQFQVIILNNFPFAYIYHNHTSEPEEYHEIVIGCINIILPPDSEDGNFGELEVDLRYYPFESLNNTISAFSKHVASTFLWKFKEYVISIDEEYEYV